MPVAVLPGQEAAVMAETVLRLKARHKAVSPYAAYVDNPVGFVTDILGEYLWSKQREIAEAVAQHRRTAVHSAHDIGKSFDASRIMAWWMNSKPDPFVVSTAPTYPQVRAILWRELARAWAKGRLPGRLNQTEVWVNNEMRAFGRKPSDYDPAAFQGIHARSVLVVIDEASGVPESLWIAAETLVTNEDSRILAIGNPDDPSAYFARICQPGSGWHVIHVDGFESPNFTDEEIPEYLHPLLLSRLWVEERRADWGEGTPLWQSKVRGLFPEEASDAVVPLSWVRRCQEERVLGETVPVELGVDLGAGGDQTVIRERRGAAVGRVWRSHSADPMEVVGLVVQAIQETGATAVKVDVIGIGWGVAGRLVELKGEAHNAAIIGVNVGMASYNPQRFPRLRDQLWWEIGRELCQDRVWDLRELDDTTIAQLIAPRYSLDSFGRIKVEPKDETRKRLGRSPDDADALLLAYLALPVEAPEGVVIYDNRKEISPV